ncbi:MAG TPA: helix-turn-helix domain-containing protein [Ilumatobacteraceae bacterium]|nr:helix-turn-helix domain-containing protein [Ilumatobacteraceae bacterium]
MPEVVKHEIAATRRYDASGRREQARRTRAAVITAARTMFLESGYAATTLTAVARSAGVSVETIYKVFGNKPGLVKAVFDVAVVGDDEPIPMMQREFVRRNMAERDPRKRLSSYGTHVAEVAERTSPLLLVVRQAAANDAAAAEVWEQMQRERLTGMTVFAQHLAEAGQLRADIAVDEARDVLWTFNSVELWDLLVNQRGWSSERFGDWIGHQLIAALLPRSR